MTCIRVDILVVIRGSFIRKCSLVIKEFLITTTTIYNISNLIDSTVYTGNVTFTKHSLVLLFPRVLNLSGLFFVYF